MALQDDVLGGGEVGERGNLYVLGLGWEKLSIDRERGIVPGFPADNTLFGRDVRDLAGLAKGGVTGSAYAVREDSVGFDLISATRMPRSSFRGGCDAFIAKNSVTSLS